MQLVQHRLEWASLLLAILQIPLSCSPFLLAFSLDEVLVKSVFNKLFTDKFIIATDL